LYGYGSSNNFHFVDHRNWVEVIFLLKQVISDCANSRNDHTHPSFLGKSFELFVLAPLV
jgi:hypothetical protein